MNGRVQKFALPCLSVRTYTANILEYLYPFSKSDGPLHLIRSSHNRYIMDISHSIHSEVSSLSFSFLSADDIKAISVKKVDNPILLDNLNLPTRGGLYDPKLGPMGSRDL